MDIKVRAHACNQITTDTLRRWYEDATVPPHRDEGVLDAIDYLLEYGLTEREYQEWKEERPL